MLMISFIFMVFIGLGNKIFQKLMTIPMYNYPNFVNLLTTFWYVPLSFAYIVPMARAGRIPREQMDMPKKPFAIMGILDAIAGIMQVFSATYLDGALLILLSQAAIPISMIMSRIILKVTYKNYQYCGAVVVAGGIACVLGPHLTGSGGSKTIIWALVMIFSCVPMCLSSIYKEIALGETDLDPVFLNGWIAIFQFIASIILAVPSALASDPIVYPDGLPRNLWQGLKCYFGMNSING
jgi:drug/metabolite transporter (DMT)-like permease